MIRYHRFSIAFVLALALLVGQQVAALHALGHAIGAVQGHEHPGAPLEQKCDSHFACAQLSSAVGVSPPEVPKVDPAVAPRTVLSLDGAAQPARLAYRSQAPPA
jgi:hypothetical protein